MKIPFYHTDAFTDSLFQGNPAITCLLEDELSDEIMQKIAFENNITETSFLVARQAGEYDIRWFTPQQEVLLCGHATLAAGFICLQHLHPELSHVTFHSKSGDLIVTKQGKYLQMDLPLMPINHCDAPAYLVNGLGVTPVETFQGYNFMAVLENEQQVRDCIPNMSILSELSWRGLIITAPSRDPAYDFVSRFFVPKMPKEDPVTGSAHCSMAPYWTERLGKKVLRARQLSTRGGTLICEVQGERVMINGEVKLYSQGYIFLN